ncbi:Uncharacterised protein [Brucella anthropi]|nr:Uncharacterised protein [Brucella anthropi]
MIFLLSRRPNLNLYRADFAFNRFYCRGWAFLVGSSLTDRISNEELVPGVLVIVASLS